MAQGEIDADAVHQSLLAGLLSHVGVRDEQKREYAGARGTRFGISPGSALFRKQPQFVMAEELVETSRLWARINARIDPVWAEQLGEHLVKRQYSEPRWSGGVARPSRPSGSPSTACRSSSDASSGSVRSTPSWPVTSSSGTPSSRATGTPSTPSSATTPPSSSGSASSRRAPGVATSSSTTAR